MTLPQSERDKRESIGGTMRDIAREIWRLPAARQGEVADRLLVIRRNLEKENARPVHRVISL